MPHDYFPTEMLNSDIILKELWSQDSLTQQMLKHTASSSLKSITIYI